VICRFTTTSDTPSGSDPEITVPFADNWTKEEEQDDDCVFCAGSFSWDQNVEEWLRCEKYLRWINFVFVWGKIFL
jgi:hypothetical protein